MPKNKMFEIKKGSDICDNEFPISEQLNKYAGLISDVDTFGKKYFNIDSEGVYIVISYDVYNRFSDTIKRGIEHKSIEWKLNGHEKEEDLKKLLDDIDIPSSAAVLAITTKSYNGLEPQELRRVTGIVKQIETDLDRGFSTGLDSLLRNESVVQMVESDNGFLKHPEISRKMRDIIVSNKMPVYIAVDVSPSMDEEARILYAKEVSDKITEYTLHNRITDEVHVIPFSNGRVEYDFKDSPYNIEGRSGTGTGKILREIKDEIMKYHPNEPVFVALVTDGEPTTAEDIDGNVYTPQEYAEEMSRALPENAVLGQICFAPINPGNPSDPSSMEYFNEYISTVRKITEVRKIAQTMILVRETEKYLPYVLLAAHQEAKYTEFGLKLLGN